jgi:maleamate amidohydrolase
MPPEGTTRFVESQHSRWVGVSEAPRQSSPTQLSKGFDMASEDRFEDHCWKDVISAEDVKLYSTYARNTFVGPSPAVLAIDLYNVVYRGGPHSPYELEDRYPNSCGIYAHQAVEPTKAVLEAARAAQVPIFFCTKDVSTNNRPEPATSTKRKQSTPGVDDYEIYREFAVEPQDVVIRKQRASIFEGTPLLSHLNLLGIRSLIVLGEATSGCVRASVVEGFSAGFHVSVVEECTFDRAQLTHKVNLFDMHHKYADVLHVDEVLEHLRARTGE